MSAVQPQIRALYTAMPDRLARARRTFGRPLTLTEKILVAHCWDFDAQTWERGKAILRLRVDRVALQDVTGQMALFQFMMSGRKDRKSTRLNSSHQIISYAVFCLK